MTDEQIERGWGIVSLYCGWKHSQDQLKVDEMVECINQDDVAVFQLRGDYGSLANEPIRTIDAALSRHVDLAATPRVVLDLSRTPYFGVDFLNVLEQLSDKISARSGRMALCGLTPFCAEVIDCARLTKQLSHHATCDEAIAAVAIA